MSYMSSQTNYWDFNPDLAADSPSSGSGSNIAVGSSGDEDLCDVSAPPEGPFIFSSAMIDASAPAEGPYAYSPDMFSAQTVMGSAPDEDRRDYAASLESNIRAHVWEGGLRYHAFRDGKYAFPNDEVEQSRDDMKHSLAMLLCRDKLFYAPVDRTLKAGGEVLDLGTGTGIWALELAEKFHRSTVNGIDLSPIQPNYVPRNVFFNVDDFEDDWVFRENRFDFIHMRYTLHSVKDRATLMRRIYKHLKPGGYVEFQEMHYSPQSDDGTLTESTPSALCDFTTTVSEGMRALGSELNAVVTLPDEMRAAGFSSIRTVSHKAPIGSWPREKRLRQCGVVMRTAILDGLSGLTHRPLGRGLGWTPVQIEMFLVHVRRALMDSAVHAYFPFHVVYGRKPLS